MGGRFRVFGSTEVTSESLHRLLVLALAVGLSGCFSTSPDHTVERVETSPSPVDAAQGVGSFAEAVDRLALRYAERAEATEDERRILEGLEALYRSDFDRAREVFEATLEETQNEAVADLAVLALAKVHTGQSNWAALAALFETQPEVLPSVGQGFVERPKRETVALEGPVPDIRISICARIAECRIIRHQGYT